MPQSHVQKHPELKQLILSTQMRYLIQNGRMKTSVGRAKRLRPVIENTISTVVNPNASPVEVEAIRTRFWVLLIIADQREYFEFIQFCLEFSSC